VIFAVPIICESDTEEILEPDLYDSFTQRCSNTTVLRQNGTDHGIRYQIYKECIENKVDLIQLKRDIGIIIQSFREVLNKGSTYTDQQKSFLIASSRKYCPNLTNIVRSCDNDIYKQCFAAAADALRSVLNFFCENDSEQVIKFTSGNVIECFLLKINELRICYNLSKIRSTITLNPYQGMPIAFKFSNSIERLRKCAVPLFEQCESATPSTLVKSLFTRVLEEPNYSSFGNVISPSLTALTFFLILALSKINN